jgi:hypothetical protein
MLHPLSDYRKPQSESLASARGGWTKDQLAKASRPFFVVPAPRGIAVP